MVRRGVGTIPAAILDLPTPRQCPPLSERTLLLHTNWRRVLDALRHAAPGGDKRIST